MCYAIIQTEYNNSLPSGQNTPSEEFPVFTVNAKIPWESRLPIFVIDSLHFTPSLLTVRGHTVN